MTAVGVVACETLYADIGALRPDADVRYVPQEYHEFPVSVPLDTAIADEVQSNIDALDSPERDRIVVIYARTSDGLTGVQSTYAPLVVSRADDCIALFTAGIDDRSTEPGNDDGIYYLTRGWIDCGVDSYKLYKAYKGEAADLVSMAETAAGDRRVTWTERESYRRAVERGHSLSDQTVDQFFHRIVGYFDRIRLVDTGHLHPYHHEYAAAFRSFVETLKAEYGGGGSVGLSVVEGDRRRLATLLGDTPQESPVGEVYAPGSPVQ